MPKIDKINVVEVWAYDILFDILKDSFRVIYISYLNLYKEKINEPYRRPIDAKKWLIEDIITDDLIKDEDSLPKLFDYRIVNQQKDAKKRSRIDIAIQWSLTIGLDYDIKIECKLLNRSNLDYYINGGLKKFKENIYSAKLNIAGMLAYNTSGFIQENTNELNKKITHKYSPKEALTFFKIVDSCKYSYKSTHSRISNSDIDLYTMVLDCRDIIKN